MKRNRGISQVISAVILASVSVTLIIAFLGYAIVTLETASQQAEFERAKSLMKTLAEETVNTVLTGVGSEINFPSRTLRLNLITSNDDISLQFLLNGSPPTPGQLWVTVASSFLTVTCLGGEFVSSENEVIYGLRENLAFVDDAYFLPLVQSFWNVSEGRVAVSINFTRLLYQEFNYSNTLVIELSYINATWQIEEEASGEILEIRYLGSNTITLYEGYISGLTNATFHLSLNNGLVDIGDPDNNPRLRYGIQNCNLIVRLIIHNVLYKVR